MGAHTGYLATRDRENDFLPVTGEHCHGQPEPVIHAEGIRSGGKIPDGRVKPPVQLSHSMRQGRATGKNLHELARARATNSGPHPSFWPRGWPHATVYVRLCAGKNLPSLTRHARL